MKNSEILNLYNGLSDINLKGVKFSYAIAKNMALLKPEVDSLSKAKEASQEFATYDQERVELAKKHAKKDENGEPITFKIIQNGKEVENFAIENQSSFDKDFEKLKKTHAKAIKEREKQIKDFNDLLEKETKIDLFKIKIEDVPEDITSGQMVSIYQLIEE